MDFLQGFGKRVSAAAKNVSKRTVEATEIARLNNRIAAIKEEEESLYRQIGKVYYESQGIGERTDDLRVMCERINALREENVSLTRLMDEVRRILRCPSCGEQQPDNASYCAKCGTKLIKFEKPKPEPEPVDEQVTISVEEASSGQSPDVFINWPESTKEHPSEEEKKD